ncbi:hypothetical protein M0805_009870 [Coniferiporia weirii]|nr:hypothetical protein M0805_009870 [Coniferiporia weirii]
MPKVARSAPKKSSMKSPLTAAKPASKKVEKPVESDGADEEEEKEAMPTKESKTKKLKGKERETVVKPAEKKTAAKERVAKKTEAKVVEPEPKKEVKVTKEKAAKKSKPEKKPIAVPEVSDAGSDDLQTSDKIAEEGEGESDGEESEEEVLLHGFSSESDSSDEDDDVDNAPIDVGKLPTIAKDDATVKRKLEKAKKRAVNDRGILYLGRIPHGFYEDQMKAYFSQFGDVTRTRLSRNKKTGRSKHYAFIEFSSSAVAEIVAETMDNYLLMGHILRCKLIPKEDVHPELWVGANRKFRRVPVDRIARQQQNKVRTDEEKEKVEKRLLKRQEQKKRKLQAAGIDYDFGRVAYTKKVKQSA